MPSTPSAEPGRTTDVSAVGRGPQQAIDAVHRRAASSRAVDRERATAVLARHDIGTSIEDLAAGLVDAPITVNFHPDRRRHDGGLEEDAAAGLRRDGRFRTQYETGTGAGSLTARPGGDRTRWEDELFAGAYDVDRPGDAGVRPRYGGMNLGRHLDGACPRFGSCHLQMRSSTRRRATFCVGDSWAGPSDVGTAEEPYGVLAGLLERADQAEPGLVRFETATPVAPPFGRVADLVGALSSASVPTMGRALDDYVEVQIHGPVELVDHVEQVAIDPSYRSTRYETDLATAAGRADVAVIHTPGFELDIDRVDGSFRGPHLPAVARFVAERFAVAHLDAAVIGWAAGLGDDAVDPQHVKHLWHATVAFGDPAGSGAPDSFRL